MDDDVIFCYERQDRECPSCNGELNANGRYKVSINKYIDVEKQQYICKDCDESNVINLRKFFQSFDICS